MALGSQKRDGRRRAKLAYNSKDAFNTGANFHRQTKAIFTDRANRNSMLNNIGNQLDRVANTRKIEIAEYLGGLDHLATLCNTYLESQGKIKRIKMKAQSTLGRPQSQSVEAVTRLRDSALQRLQDIEQSISLYNEYIRGKTAELPKLEEGKHVAARRAGGKALDEHVIKELVMEDTLESFPDRVGPGALASPMFLDRQRAEIDVGARPVKEHYKFRKAQIDRGGLWHVRRLMKTQPGFLTGTDLDGTPVKQLAYLRKRDDLLPFKITFREKTNLVFDAKGNPLDTTMTEGGSWMYAVDNVTGEFFAMPGQRDMAHHSSFFAGMPVMCAGDIYAVNGALKCLTNTSGHYQPGKDHLHDACHFLRNEWGVDLGKEGDANCVKTIVVEGDVGGFDMTVYTPSADELLQSPEVINPSRKVSDLGKAQQAMSGAIEMRDPAEMSVVVEAPAAVE